MKYSVLLLCALASCSAVGRYEMVGSQGKNLLLLDTETGQLEVQAIPDVPATLPDHKPRI